ncbi:MAG: hypothetical protein ACUVQ0_06145 [Thermoproteota archaeon]
MAKCLICGEDSPLIAGQLGVCLKCIRSKPEKAIEEAKHLHAETRKAFKLPPAPIRDSNGVSMRCLRQWLYYRRR